MSEDCCSHTSACCAPPPLKTPEPKAVETALVASCADDVCGCHGGVPVFDGLDPRYKRVLWTVIAVNGAMFLTEMVQASLPDRRP